MRREAAWLTEMILSQAEDRASRYLEHLIKLKRAIICFGTFDVMINKVKAIPAARRFGIYESRAESIVGSWAPRLPGLSIYRQWYTHKCQSQSVPLIPIFLVTLFDMALLRYLDGGPGLDT